MKYQTLMTLMSPSLWKKNETFKTGVYSVFMKQISIVRSLGRIRNKFVSTAIIKAPRMAIKVTIKIEVEKSGIIPLRILLQKLYTKFWSME